MTVIGLFQEKFSLSCFLEKKKKKSKGTCGQLVDKVLEIYSCKIAISKLRC